MARARTMASLPSPPRFNHRPHIPSLHPLAGEMRSMRRFYLPTRQPRPRAHASGLPTQVHTPTDEGSAQPDRGTDGERSGTAETTAAGDGRGVSKEKEYVNPPARGVGEMERW